MWVIVLILIAVAVFYLLRKKDENKQMEAARRTIVYSNTSEAAKHYKRGNNLWAEDLHAALAEFEIALRLEPDNKDYQFAVKHAKENIEIEENS